MKYVIIGISVVLFIILISFLVAKRKTLSAFLVVVAHPYEQYINDMSRESILVAGDSTGYGTGVFNPKYSIAGRIGALFPEYAIENVSKNGATTKSLVEVIKRRHNRDKYDLVLLQIGGNDILDDVPLEIIEEQILELLEYSKTLTDAVILMSTGNVGAAETFVKDGTPDSYLEDRTRKVRDIFIRVSEEMNVTYVDLFVEPEQDVFLKEPKIYLAIDGLHPSKEGYGEWFEKLQPALETKLH